MNYIPISMVSSFAGRHIWCTFEESFLKILKNYKKDEFSKLMHIASQDIIYKQNIDFIKTTIPNINYDDNLSATQNYNKLILNKNVCKLLNNITSPEIVIKKITEEHEEIVKHKIQNTIEYKNFINDSTGDVEIPVFKEYSTDIVKSISLKDRGTNLEYSTVDFLKSRPKILKDRYGKYFLEEQVYIKRYFSTDQNSDPLGYDKYPKIKGIIYTISGSVDALIPDMCVLEIKNRQNEFMEPSYDIDQLCVYMIILKLDGRLVQQFQDFVKIGKKIKYQNAEKRWIESLKPDLDIAIINSNRLLATMDSKEMIDIVHNNTF